MNLQKPGKTAQHIVSLQMEIEEYKVQHPIDGQDAETLIASSRSHIKPKDNGSGRLIP